MYKCNLESSLLSNFIIWKAVIVQIVRESRKNLPNSSLLVCNSISIYEISQNKKTTHTKTPTSLCWTSALHCTKLPHCTKLLHCTVLNYCTALNYCTHTAYKSSCLLCQQLPYVLGNYWGAWEMIQTFIEHIGLSHCKILWIVPWWIWGSSSCFRGFKSIIKYTKMFLPMVYWPMW